MQEELKKTKDQVLYLLERYPAARNNDFYLQLLWLKQFGGIVELPWIDWEKIKAKKNEERGDAAVRAIDVDKALIDDLEKKDKATIEAALKEMKKYLTPLDFEEVKKYAEDTYLR